MAKKKKKKEKSLYDRRIKGWAGRYGLLIFISAWMFVIGVLVGRGTAPVKFKTNNLPEELATLKEADIQKQMARVKIKTEDSKAKTDLDFYQELKKNKRPVKQTDSRKNVLTKTPAKKETRATDNKNASKPTAAKSQTQNKAVKKSLVVKLPAPEPVQSKKPGNSGKNLTIQAASLKDRSEADVLVKTLKGKGYPAFKTIGVVPNKGIWFRVRIGHYSSKAEAADTLKRLKKDGFKPYLVTR